METTDITIILKSGNDKLYKDIYDLNLFGDAITFKVKWKTVSGSSINTKSFTFKDFAGYAIAKSNDNKKEIV